MFKTLTYSCCLLIVVLAASCAPVSPQPQAQTPPPVQTPAQPQAQKNVLVGVQLEDGFDMGVNTHPDSKTDWLSSESGYMKASFPADQKSAFVFITVGEPTEPPRPSLDFSAYNSLSIQMRGAAGGEKIEIGIKTNTQPDNGKETKIPYTLTANWVAYEIPLQRFTGTDLSHLYVVTELVYNGQTPQTVYFKDIKFTK